MHFCRTHVTCKGFHRTYVLCMGCYCTQVLHALVPYTCAVHGLLYCAHVTAVMQIQNQKATCFETSLYFIPEHCDCAVRCTQQHSTSIYSVARHCKERIFDGLLFMLVLFPARVSHLLSAKLRAIWAPPISVRPQWDKSRLISVLLTRKACATACAPAHQICFMFLVW